MHPEGPSVAVCALTFRRPAGLQRLLEGLAALRFDGSGPRLRVVIIDNDPAGSGRATCDAFRTQFPWPLEYHIETRRGIAFARNAALNHARSADWIAFIDDDEKPDPNWLNELFRVQQAEQADVTAGPVIPEFAADAPDWLREGGFFDRRRYLTGQRLGHAFTNNVLFRSSLLEELQLRFNERWALMGCEDRAFFQTIGMAGHRIIWANDAVVREQIPPERANAAWLVQRHYRVGNSTSFVERDLRGAWRAWPVQLAKSMVWLLIGLGRGLLWPFAGMTGRVRARQALAYGAGLLTGLLGRPYEEYRQSDDSTPTK